MTIKYICSNGTEFDLNASKLRVIEGNYHVRSWSAVTSDKKLGTLIKSFNKSATTYSLTAQNRGAYKERTEMFTDLANAFDVDIRTDKPGKLVYGDYSIEGYGISSETTASERVGRTEMAIEFYCPYPFWIKETVLEPFLVSSSSSEDETGLDYPYDYPYDYASVRESVRTIKNDSPFASAFRMTVWGPATNPSILIAGHTYKLNGTIASGERVEIDSKNKAIYHYSAANVKTNWFGKRYKQESIFESIPAGVSALSWSGSFGFSMTLLDERSEPPWEV